MVCLSPTIWYMIRVKKRIMNMKLDLWFGLHKILTHSPYTDAKVSLKVHALVYKDPAVQEQLIDALRKAGLK